MDHPVRCVHGPSSAHQSYWSDYWLPEGGALGIRPTADVELLGIVLNVLPWVIAVGLLVWI